jgi:D-sedoheptulose 7-phosphate isomerase
MLSTYLDAANLLREGFSEHRQVADATELAIAEGFGRLADLCAAALSSGGKLLFFGNGGSAADAQHIAAELVVRFRADRRPLAAIALTSDASTLTAAGNDLGFEQIFARQILALARHCDVAIGLSTSGRSPNVLAALAEARAVGCHAAALTGGDGGELKELADPLIIIPTCSTARVQEMHILIGHSLCDALEQRFCLVSGVRRSSEP